MIDVIETSSGRFNLLGIEDDAFVLQGNLNVAQLEELVAKALVALEASKQHSIKAV